MVEQDDEMEIGDVENVQISNVDSETPSVGDKRTKKGQAARSTTTTTATASPAGTQVRQ